MSQFFKEIQEQLSIGRGKEKLENVVNCSRSFRRESSGWGVCEVILSLSVLGQRIRPRFESSLTNDKTQL